VCVTQMDPELLRTFLDVCQRLCVEDTAAAASATHARHAMNEEAALTRSSTRSASSTRSFSSTRSCSSTSLSALAAPHTAAATAQRLLCARALKALWELLSLPGLGRELQRRPVLLTALYAQCTQRTTVSERERELQVS
jgi:hypothetical protein